MATPYFYKGKPLFVDGKVAMAKDCCCGPPFDPPSVSHDCVIDDLDDPPNTITIPVQGASSVDLTIGNCKPVFSPICAEGAGGVKGCESLQATHSLPRLHPESTCVWLRSFDFCCENPEAPLYAPSQMAATLIRQGGRIRWRLYIILQNNVVGGGPDPGVCRLVSQIIHWSSLPLPFDAANGYYKTSGAWAMSRYLTAINPPQFYCDPFDQVTLDVTPELL